MDCITTNGESNLTITTNSKTDYSMVNVPTLTGLNYETIFIDPLKDYFNYKTVFVEPGPSEIVKKRVRNKRLRGLIKRVVFNGPATIVFWNDGTKTVVKCAEGETYDKEKGLLAAMAKKFYENTNIFVEELEKWCGEPVESDEEAMPQGFDSFIDAIGWVKEKG